MQKEAIRIDAVPHVTDTVTDTVMKMGRQLEMEFCFCI